VTNVGVEGRGPVAHLVLNRPPLNVLTTAMLAEFAAGVRDRAGREETRVLVVRGEGKGFSAGLDVKEHLPETVESMLAAFRDALAAILQCRVPVVAQVHGPCLGGGMELAMAADLVYAADTAAFGQPEIKLGVFPPFAAATYPTWFGRARAADLVLLGESIPANEAFDRGFVSGVVPAADLAAKVGEVCGKLAALSPSSLRFAREALRLGNARGIDALDAIEALYLDDLMATEDAREGLQSFLEKRPPKWGGR
jgi:cyclohexa-1,5-dienecarbonyl-CoA hydratase